MYFFISNYARGVNKQVLELNRLIHKGIANMPKKTDILMKRIRYIIFLSTGLILAACSSQPTVSPDTATPAATAGEQSSAISKDVIDTTGLAAYYPFNGSAKDSSGYGNHGTVHGGEFVADRLGKPAGAFALDGVDDYISIAGTKSLDVAFEMSIALWLYHKTQDSQKDWYSLVEKSDPDQDGHSRYGMWLIRDLVEICVQPVDVSLPHRCLDSEITLEPEQWHHLVGVSDGRVLRVYINGQLAGEKDFASRSDTSKSHFELFIGTDLYASSVIYVKGIIDELRLYKRALSETEVKTLYQAKQP